MLLCLAAGGLGAAAPVEASPQAPGVASGESRPAAEAPAPDPRALLDEYCVVCHNARTRTAGLLLDRADVHAVAAGAETWEKVVRKLRSGAMPPPGRRRPDPQTLDAFVTGLETELDAAAAARPNPGRPPDHRLNRFEYGNALRDLLDLEIDVEALLPPDESDQGFDNIAEVLSMSPTLLGGYLFAARRISQLAVGDPSAGPAVETFRVSRGMRQDERMGEDLPYGTRGGIAVRHYFPLDGEYVVKIRLGRNFTNSQIRAIATREEIDVLLDGVRITRLEIGGRCTTPSDDDPACTGSGIYRTSRYQLIGRRGARGAVRGAGRHAHARRRLRPQERAHRGSAADPAAAAAHQLDLRSAAHGRRLRAAGGAVQSRPAPATRRAGGASSCVSPRGRAPRSRRPALARSWAGSPGAPIVGRSRAWTSTR